MSKTVALRAKIFCNPTEKIPLTSKEFSLWTKGGGVICQGCNTKTFYGLQNWKNHIKTKKHIKWKENFIQPSKNNIEIEKLKQDLKNQKQLTTKYSNMYEQTKNRLREIEKELVKIKKELKKKFNIN